METPETPGSVSPENAGGSFSFNVGGEVFGFDGKFTAGRFTGMIRGVDGKEFAGLVEDLGGGRYKVEDNEGGRIIESPAEVGTAVAEALAAAPAEVGPGLDDAAVAAMEAAPPQVVAAPAPETAQIPQPEPQPVPSPAVETAQEPIPTPESAGEAEPLEENRHPLAVELQQKIQSVYQPLRAVRLWRQAENARAGVDKTNSKTKIERLFTQERELKDRAKELYPGIEKMTDTERGELSRKIVPLSAEGAGAIRISSPRHREDMAVFYEAELQKWENILRDPRDFEQYRARTAEVESQKSAARQLFPDEGDKRLLDQAIVRIEQRGSGWLKEFGTKLPRRLLEMAGFIPSESLTLGQVESDMDLRLAYNRAAQQLYSELTGQPQAVQPGMPVAPEPIAPPEPAIEPVIEPTAELTVEATEAVPTETPEPGVAEYEEGAPEPVEAPMPGEVVVSGEEQARAAAAKPAEAAVAPVAPTEEAPAAPVEAPMSEGAERVEAPVAEAAAETPEQRFERRKQGFAGALAELDRARNDASGTEREQKIRLTEAFNQAIGAAMEFMNEGDGAREVVREFLAGALGTSGGRKLTEVAVRSRMDEAGVFQAATPEERKKKLEEAGLWGLLTLLLELGMSFTDNAVGAVVSEVQSATGAGR